MVLSIHVALDSKEEKDCYKIKDFYLPRDNGKREDYKSIFKRVGFMSLSRNASSNYEMIIRMLELHFDNDIV